MLVYATPSDLASWAGPNVDLTGIDTAFYLRSASVIIARAVNESLYDPGAVTSDPKRDATCAQVVAWVAAKVTPGSGGISNDPVVESKSIEGASITYDTSLSGSVTAFQARAALANELAAEAEAILRSAGVLYADLPVWSATPDQGQYVNEFGVVGGNFGFTGSAGW